MSKYTLSEINGCCYIPETKLECKNLDSGKCKIKSLPCKMIACKYLKNYGINYYVYFNLEIKIFFRLIKRPSLVWNFFKNKDEILSKC